MNARPDHGPAAARSIELAPVLDLNAASPLAAELLASRGEPIRIDASRVQRIGGQCLQVLLSACKTWKADAVPLAVVAASPDFLEGLRRLGATAPELIDQDYAE